MNTRALARTREITESRDLLRNLNAHNREHGHQPEEPLTEAEIRAGTEAGKLIDPLRCAVLVNYADIRALARELRSWAEDIEDAVTPRTTGGQTCNPTTPSLRSSLRHLIMVADRLRARAGYPVDLGRRT